MEDPGGNGDGASGREWLSGLVVVSIAAVLVVGLIVWFAMTFLVQDCCTDPPPEALAAGPATSTSAGSPSLGPLSPPASMLMPTPTGSPTPVPSAAVRLGEIRIPFAGREMVVSIVGEPSIVAGWRAATDTDLEPLSWPDGIDIALEPMSDREAVLWWIGTVCDVDATLTITMHRLAVEPAPRDGCDAMAVRRGLVLDFTTAVDPSAISVELAAPPPMPS